MNITADFDGDSLNIFRVIGLDLGKKFAKCMDPMYNIFVSRLNGKVNRESMPMKDEAVGFWGYNNL